MSIHKRRRRRDWKGERRQLLVRLDPTLYDYISFAAKNRAMPRNDYVEALLRYAIEGSPKP